MQTKDWLLLLADLVHMKVFTWAKGYPSFGYLMQRHLVLSLMQIISGPPQHAHTFSSQQYFNWQWNDILYKTYNLASIANKDHHVLGTTPKINLHPPVIWDLGQFTNYSSCIHLAACSAWPPWLPFQKTVFLCLPLKCGWWQQRNCCNVIICYSFISLQAGPTNPKCKNVCLKHILSPSYF